MGKYKIGDICNLEKGKQIDTSLLSNDNKYKYINGGITESGYYTDFNTSGCVVTVSEGGASCGFVNYTEEPFWCGCHCYRLTNIQFPPKYIYYALKANQERIMALRTGSAMPNIKKSSFAQLEIQLSEIREEQERIVHNLEHIDSLICKRKAQCELLDELVKARFVEMFGNPVLNEKRWNQVPLSACVKSIDNGKSFVCDSAARQDDWPAVLKLSAATYGYYRPEENKALLDKKQFVEESAVCAGDLLFTRKNTPELVGMCAYVYDTPGNLMMPDLIFRLNTTEECNKIFLWKLINHELFRERIQAIATGSAKSMSNISKERLLGIEIILPPIELQDQFSTFVKATDKSKATIQSSLDELETLKKSLVQNYFG